MALALSTVTSRNRGVLRHTDILWMRTTVGERSGSRPLLDEAQWYSETHVAHLVDMSHKISSARIDIWHHAGSPCVQGGLAELT